MILDFQEILVELDDIFEQSKRHESVYTRLKFNKQVNVDRISLELNFVDDIGFALAVLACNKMRVLFLKGRKIKVLNEFLIHE